MERWAISLHFTNFASNLEMGGKIWVCWKDEIEMDVVGITNQSLNGLFEASGGNLLTIFVYAKCTQIERQELWSHLSGVSCAGLAWVVLGGFNIIRSNEERVGGRLRLLLAMNDFNACINRCGLLDLRLEGRQLSWCNGQQGMTRSWAKLDRVLVCLDRVQWTGVISSLESVCLGVCLGDWWIFSQAGQDYTKILR